MPCLNRFLCWCYTLHAVLLPSLFLGPVIGVLVVMALDEKKKAPPPAPKHRFLAAPMRTLEQSHKRLALMSEGEYSLEFCLPMCQALHKGSVSADIILSGVTPDRGEGEAEKGKEARGQAAKEALPIECL